MNERQEYFSEEGDLEGRVVNVYNDDNLLEDLMNDLGEDANRRETIVPRSNSEASAEHYVHDTNVNPADFTDFEA